LLETENGIRRTDIYNMSVTRPLPFNRFATSWLSPRLEDFLNTLRLLVFSLTARPPNEEEVALLSQCVVFISFNSRLLYSFCSGMTFQLNVRLE
jgi:hypothetical protein